MMTHVIIKENNYLAKTAHFFAIGTKMLLLRQILAEGVEIICGLYII